MRILAISLASALALAAAATAQAQNLVQNGGFEDGFSNWSEFSWGVSTGLADVGPAEGSYYAYNGCVNQFCDLSQDVTTTAGGRYDISFAFNPGDSVSNGGGETDVYFGGTLLASIVGGSVGWTTYNFSNVLASDSTTTLLFSAYQNPAYNGVDAVSVQVSGGVPEPASWAMMLGGFSLVGGAMRSRRKAAVSFA